MESIFLYVLYRSLLVTVVILAVFALRYLFEKRLSPTARHAFWFFLLPVMLLPMSVVPIPVPTENQPIQEASPTPIPSARMDGTRSDMSFDLSPTMLEEPFESQIRTVVPPLLHVESTADTPVETQYPFQLVSLSFLFLSATLWGLGIVVLSGLSLVQVFYYRHRFSKASSITDENTLDLLNLCRNDLKVKTPVQLLESRRLLFPVLAGIGNPRIILPIGFIGRYSDEQLTHFLLHELAHLKRRDILTGWLMSLFCIVHWFNPFVWIAIRAMNRDTEEAADQLATGAFDKKQRIEYGLTLLALSERLNKIPKRILLPLSECVPGVVGLMESSTQLSRRIEMLKQRETWHRGWMCLTFILCLAISAATLTRFQFVAAQTTESDENKTSLQKNQDDPEEKEGDSFGGLTWFKASGKIVAPAGIDFGAASKEFAIKAVCHSVINPGESGASDAEVGDDGTFSCTAWGNRDYAFFFHDSDLRWAAKPVFLSVGNESPTEKVVIQLEKGSLIEATLLDRETGKPISGMTVWLSQKAEWKESRAASKVFENGELLQTDENGQIKRLGTPGKFRFTVDMPAFSWEDGERLYSIDFEVKEGADAKPVLKIPTPFVGQVLDDEGKPVENARVSIHGPVMDFLFTHTDKNGYFKRRTPPKNSLIEIYDRQTRDEVLSHVGWVKDELKNDGIWKVKLQKGQTVTGRLLDAATGKPLSKTLFFYRYENPLNSQQKDFMPSSTRTDGEGYFKAKGLAAGLNYRFFFVPGRTRDYGGGPYSPRVELAFLKTDKPGESVDLGDLKVDPSLAGADPKEEEAENLDKRIAEELSSVLNGEKQGGLVLLVSSDDDPFLKQLTKRENEEPLSFFAVAVVKRDEFPEGFLEAFSGDTDNCLFLVGPPDGERPPLPVSLRQLRGEMDSPWNVPKDDPSTSGDWKKTPGMVNPKILDNFLNDYLKKFEKQDKPKGGVEPMPAEQAAELSENAIVCSVFLGVAENGDSKQSLLSMISEKQKGRNKPQSGKSSGEEMGSPC